MSGNTGSAIPLRMEDLQLVAKRANDLLVAVNYLPKKSVSTLRAELGPKENAAGWSSSSATSTPRAESLSVLKIAKEVNRGDEILPDNINASLTTVRFGFQVGLHLATLYARSSGFDTLQSRKEQSQLTTEAEKAEWLAKQETHAAITVFAATYYILWKLASTRGDELAGTNVDFPGLPEPVALGGQQRALNALVFHWGSYLKEAQTDQVFLKVTERYFAAVLEELKSRAPALKYLETFIDNTYKLEGTPFTIHGFDGDIKGAGPAVEFKRVELTEVVGNHEAKRLAKRLVQFMLAYDFERKMNPLMEVGAFPWLSILQGQAGTGKSMLLAVMQTLAQDYCKALGIPFRVFPIPNAIIQSLQGESAKVYENWWNAACDPSFLTVAPVDDAEAVYLDRRSHSSSEGSKLIVMAHLRLTEGSTAMIRGNMLQPHATNNADMIDAPVFSRYMARVIVPGAETRNDFNDQMRMWGDKLNKLQPTKPLIKLAWPNDYAYLSDQGFIPLDERDRKLEGLIKFKDAGLVKLWEDVERKKLSSNSYDLYGTFFSLLHHHFDQFTSRDVRNVTTTATSRLFGFDFPSEWLEKRETFVGKNYDEKKAIILDTAVQYQNGLTVEQVLFQEMVHYVETTIAMLDSGRKYRIRQMADEMKERIEAETLARTEMKTA